MTLRTRLLVAFSLMGLVLLLASLTVLRVQENYLNTQMDARLFRLSSIAEQLVGKSVSNEPLPSNVFEALWEGYLGVFDSNGDLLSVSTPASDPTLLPNVDLYSATVEPKTVAVKSGNAKRIRAMTIGLTDGKIALVGLTTTEGDNVLTQLRFTLAAMDLLVLFILAVVLWWLNRLGFRPIKELTVEADAIAMQLGKERELLRPSRRSETARLGEAIRGAIEAKEVSEARMRRFVADASHELRTPLTTLNGYSSLYLAGGLKSSAELDDAMRRINAEARRMAELINDLMILSDLDKKPLFALNEISVLSVFEDVKSDIRVSAPNRKLDFNCSSSLEVFADSEIVFQVLMILVTNALKYTTDASVISVSATEVDGGVTISVQDSGIGIEQQHLPYIFDRFYRVDDARAIGGGGRGLGLSILASLMSSIGGTYGVHSEVGVGSTFWVHFPGATE